jgi:hypothetical protein
MLAAGVDAQLKDRPAAEIHALMRKIFVSFSAADAIPDYERITIPRFRVAVSQSLCEVIVQCYEMLYQVLQNAGSGLVDDTKAPSQIATLLGIDTVQ